MRIAIIILLSIQLTFTLFAQQQQIEIIRIAQMPDFPNPYEMRDWKKVAEQYDTLVFSTTDGTHFPLLTLGSTGVNYPEIKPIFFDSYVGAANHGQAREAINILPAIVGASLVGIDKSSQFATNWVDKTRDFYNLTNGELVYLNGPSDRSGHDWWYETMPNVFFYQLYDLYPEISGFEAHFRAVADRWLEAVQVMGGSSTPWTVPEMNYRAWNLKEMKPLDEGVKEPEAAGAIAWLLYQAYKKLGDQKYLIGAQWCMEFLDRLETNPSYELQLPYGVLTAAAMNAEQGTNYELEKMINWCFDRGDLRGWGSVVGTWGGMDVSGLIGEANDQGNDYAFVMNGYQQASTLVPLIKYDKRFAAQIAKWVLNVANASRFYYSNFLGENQQSDYSWSQTYDPQSVIAYEALKENWQGTSLYARGDAKDAGWGATNFALYGSSHVGYLAAIVDQTNVAGILKLDANATDFFSPNPFPTYVLYNPFDEAKVISLKIGENLKDIYDVINEMIIVENVSGDVEVSIPAKEVLLLSYIPAGSNLEEFDDKLTIGDDILDHHYGYDYSQQLRIKSLSATDNPAEIGLKDTIYCTVDVYEGTSFQWFLDDIDQNTDTDNLIWTPGELGISTIKVVVQNENDSAVDSLQIEVVELIAENPVIDSIWTQNKWQIPGEEIWVRAEAHDPKGIDITLDWSFDQGQILELKGDSVKIRLPDDSGVFPIKLTITNTADKSIEAILEMLVLENLAEVAPLIYLPFNGDVLDRGKEGYETIVQGTSFVSDVRDEEESALAFANSSDELRILNESSLNFSDAITISFWIYVTDFNEERYIISHGGWEQRWKASVLPNQKLRWTVNTSDGIMDLDTTFPIELSSWYHITTIYSGQSMQLFINGELNSFTAHTGAMNLSNSDITIGKRLPGDDQYFLKGRIDEVKIFDRTTGPGQVELLKEQWYEISPLNASETRKGILLYPNPSSNEVWIQTGDVSDQPRLLVVFDLSGRKHLSIPLIQNPEKIEFSLPGGVYFLRIIHQDKVLGSERLIIE